MFFAAAESSDWVKLQDRVYIIVIMSTWPDLKLKCWVFFLMHCFPYGPTNEKPQIFAAISREDGY